MMFSFRNDYSETAHPRILKALVETNLEQVAPYGLDIHSKKAAEYMKKAMEYENVDIHLIPGGTQTNLLAVAAFLRPHEAVISADSGHIHGHETGSIEATGHKILAIPTSDGKLTVPAIEKVVSANSEEHTPRPKMVYLSNSTELGTVYTKAELTAISEYCKAHGILLFVDGARMGSALAWKGCGLSLSDYPRLTDAFYVGGTKNGAMLGEALVIVKDSLKEDFRLHLKQRGAMLAKGKILGIQFEELFRDGLFFQLAEHINQMADLLREGITALGYPFLVDSPSNQIFPIFPNTVLKQLEEKYDIGFWETVDDGHTAVRLVTAWATPEEQVRAFVADLKALTK